MLVYILYGLFIISCIVLVASVLLQPGKADAGALFANTTSTTAFGARGTQTLLSKITIGAAAGFMLTALLLSLPGVRGSNSVISTSEKASPAPIPAATPAATTTDANSNANANTSASPAPATSPAANSNTQATPAPAKSPAAKATPTPAKK